jgi:ligand-binding sensor domain-containing protein
MRGVFRSKRNLLVIFVIAVAAALAIAARTYVQIHKADQSLRRAQESYQTIEAVEFQLRSFRPAIDPNVRLIAGPPEHRDICEFEGKIFAATSSGLIVYSPDGKKFQQWTAVESFPSQDLTSLAVSKNTLWVGTSDAGLLRYRAEGWEQLIPLDKKFGSVTSILATPQGAVFVGTTGGLLRFSGNRFEKFAAKELLGQRITRIEGESHRLFIGTFQKGLYLYENGVFRHWDRNHGLKDSYVTDIRPLQQGCLVSTPAGIEVLSESEGMKAGRSVVSNSFVTSFLIHGDEILLSARGVGISNVSFDRNSLSLLRSKRMKLQKTAFQESGLLRTVGNTAMVFTQGGSWYLSDQHTWKRWTQSNSTLSSSNISALLRSRTGEIWIGYFDSGLDVLSSDFRLISHYQDDRLFCINYLAEDARGHIYVSTANGLVIIHPDGRQETFGERDGLMSDRVMQAVPLDPDGSRVAIATAQGFTLKDGNDMKSLYSFNGLVNNHVYSIASRGENIYLGTLGGISRLSQMRVSENWTQMDSGLKRNWIQALLPLEDRLFVGTYGGGIQVRTASGDWLQFSDLPESFEVNANAFFSDGHFLFCGTLDRGFYVYNPQNNSWQQTIRNLPSPNVTGFALAGRYLLIGTSRGLLQMQYDKINTTK